MKKIKILLLMISILFNFSIKSYSRDCPSKLESNLYEINDKIIAGIEIRGFYFYPDKNWRDALNLEKEYEANSVNETGEKEIPEHNFMGGIRPLVNFFPSDNLTIIMEADLRYKNSGFGEKDISFRLNQLTVEYMKGNFYISPGIQFFNFSSFDRFPALS